MSDLLKLWFDVLEEKWICFGCNSAALKYVPFCHHVKVIQKERMIA